MTTAIDRRAFMTSFAACGISACSPGPKWAFPELEAAGNPGDLGLAHGRAFARQIRTNHFLDPGLATGCTSGRGPSTMTRFATARRLAAELEPTVADPVRRAERILESRDELPNPISRDHNPDPSSSTLAGIIMDLTRNRFILTKGAPHLGEWIVRPGV